MGVTLVTECAGIMLAATGAAVRVDNGGACEGSMDEDAAVGEAATDSAGACVNSAGGRVQIGTKVNRGWLVPITSCDGEGDDGGEGVVLGDNVTMVDRDGSRVGFREGSGVLINIFMPFVLPIPFFT